jgi:hypothetical protein
MTISRLGGFWPSTPLDTPRRKPVLEIAVLADWPPYESDTRLKQMLQRFYSELIETSLLSLVVFPSFVQSSKSLFFSIHFRKSVCNRVSTELEITTRPDFLHFSYQISFSSICSTEMPLFLNSQRVLRQHPLLFHLTSYKLTFFTLRILNFYFILVS